MNVFVSVLLGTLLELETLRCDFMTPRHDQFDCARLVQVVPNMARFMLPVVALSEKHGRGHAQEHVTLRKRCEGTCSEPRRPAGTMPKTIHTILLTMF